MPDPIETKYIALTRWLRRCGMDRVSLSFNEVKDVLGFLPSSAYHFSFFWVTESDGSIYHGWYNAGYDMANVDMMRQCITFTRSARFDKIDDRTLQPIDTNSILQKQESRPLVGRVSEQNQPTEQTADKLSERPVLSGRWKSTESAPVRAGYSRPGFHVVSRSKPPVSEKLQKDSETHSATPTESTMRPTADGVLDRLREQHVTEQYMWKEEALLGLFLHAYPLNSSINEVLCKVAALNAFHPTPGLPVYRMAAHIVSLQADKRIQSGDITLAADIAALPGNTAVKPGFYLSFASRYCQYHKPKDYPLYDCRVAAMLCYFRTLDTFENFNRKQLLDYTTYVRVLAAFQTYYKLRNLSFDQVVKYLQLRGQEKYPKRYRKGGLR